MRTHTTSRRAAGLLAALGLLSTAFAAVDVPGDELLVPVASVADAPLVADAGASVAVAPGQRATFSGAAYGGTAPYAFRWTALDGAEVVDRANPTATVVAGDEQGQRTLELTVTDAAGATTTDTVSYLVVGGGAEQVLLDETVADTEPGAAEVTSRDFTFTVPEGLARIDVAIGWSVPANDYDLRVLDPSGTEQGYSGTAPPATTEATGIVAPAPGEWTLRATRYANAVEPSLRALVTGTAAADDVVLPRVDAGGPYTFVAGEAQQLAGSATDSTEVGWDTDLDGVVDVAGAAPVLDLPRGRHLVVLHARDGRGLEAQRMTSVRVGADADEVADLAVPITVVGLADSGINPYHAEFSAATYPDPEVLELTRGFTRHPSEYIPGYPEDAQALPITLDQGYFPEADTHLWSGNRTVQPGQLYWVPGTKIIGAIDAGGSTGVTSGDDVHPILDDNGHGTGSSSVSTGNRYGYCPTCLLVNVEALDETVVAEFDWVDVSTNSFGAVGGIPIGLLSAGGDGANDPTKAAAERGQLTFFSAGNGTGNAFATSPILTYGSSPNGADWVITVGATREDNQGAIVSDGYPVHVSALGDGDLPSACRTGTTGQCAFGGTSAASPYTAGAFAQVLTEVRDVLGDSVAGQKPGQVVAQGRPVPGSPFLEDGVLTRAEWRAVGLKTALPRSTYGEETGVPVDTTHPFPWTWSGDQSVYFEGYGSAGPAHAARAVEVLLGRAELPDRSQQDAFFADDCSYRDGLYGSYDRDGDGEPDGCDQAGFARFTGTAEPTNDDPRVDDFATVRAGVDTATPLAEPVTYFLHRRPVFEPDVEPDTTPGDPADALEGGQVCGESFNESTMSTTSVDGEDGDLEPCFDTRITTNLAPFRPRGIFTATDQLTGALPAGSRVAGSVFVQTSEPSPTGVTVVLKATDRELGRSQEVLAPTTPGGWTEFAFEFTTDRPVAPGEQLTVNLVLGVARAYAFGYEGDHASFVTIEPAVAPDDASLAFGVASVTGATSTAGAEVTGTVAVPDLGPDPQLAGFHDTSVVVQVADDASFADPVLADVDRDTGVFRAFVPGVEDGDEVHVRPLRDRVPGASATLALGSQPDDPGDDPDPDDPDPEDPGDDDRGGPPAGVPGPPDDRPGPSDDRPGPPADRPGDAPGRGQDATVGAAGVAAPAPEPGGRTAVLGLALLAASGVLLLGGRSRTRHRT